MTTIPERIGALELRVNGLETWAGPGQASVLASGLQAVRSDLAVLRRTQQAMLGIQEGMLGDLATLRGTQQEHTRALATLASDVETLKADMTDVKETLREVLRRLPPPTTGGWSAAEKASDQATRRAREQD